MNLDLLKKLTLLANRNPSETEANAAARKVCKLLEEGNWKLESVVTVKNAVPPHTTTPPRSGPAYRVWKQNEENNAKAQREANARANAQYYSERTYNPRNREYSEEIITHCMICGERTTGHLGIICDKCKEKYEKERGYKYGETKP